MKKTECGKCGADAKIVRGDYEFRETGLRDLVLLDIQLIQCGKCGNVDPILSGVDEKHVRVEVNPEKLEYEYA